MSTGLDGSIQSGNTFFILASVCGESSARSRPKSCRKSAVTIPPPPEKVTMAVPLPGFILRIFEKPLRKSISSLTSFTCMTPACLNADSMMALLPAMLAVWLMAAFAPKALLPPFNTITGLLVDLIMSMNFLPSAMDSR